MNPAFFVYRLYSESGDLLYVGATKNLRVRMTQHRTDKAWWPEVAEQRTIIAAFETEEDAAIAEFAAIRGERPRYNVASTGNRRPQMYRSPTRRRGPREPYVRKAKPSDASEAVALAMIQSELDAVDQEMREARADRDRQIVEALANGATWAQVQEVTGLSLRGVQLSIARAHAAEGS